MDWSLLFFGAVAMGCVLVIRMAVQWARALNRARVITRDHDRVINVDQWTTERRRALAQLDRPAPKGWDAKRRQQLDQAARTGGGK